LGATDILRRQGYAASECQAATTSESAEHSETLAAIKHIYRVPLFRRTCGSVQQSSGGDRDIGHSSERRRGELQSHILHISSADSGSELHRARFDAREEKAAAIRR
jgi:hypothetical protein